MATKSRASEIQTNKNIIGISYKHLHAGLFDWAFVAEFCVPKLVRLDPNLTSSNRNTQLAFFMIALSAVPKIQVSMRNHHHPLGGDVTEPFHAPT